MCGGKSLLVIYYLLGSFTHFIIPYTLLLYYSFIWSFYVCDYRKIGVWKWVKKVVLVWKKKKKKI